MSATIIETENLTKRYGRFTAVDHLDFSMEEGEVYGFLGPNGSGKSTTILMLLGLTEPTEGRARVGGFDPTRNPLQVKRMVGYLPESVGFYNDLTGRENLLYTTRLNNIPRSQADRRVDELLETVELSQAARQVVGQYSRGMRQRLGLADVLLKEPRLVILDDPTLGLDPSGVQWLLTLIQEMSSQRNITVFVSSHQLHEVQRVCNRVGIMSHGRLVLEGTITELMVRQEGGHWLELELRGATPALVEEIRGLASVEECQQMGDRLTIKSTEEIRARVLELVHAGGAELMELSSQKRTLEDIYLRYFQEA